MSVSTESAVLASLGVGAAGIDSEVKSRAYLAAEAFVSARCTWATTEAPASLVLAVQLLTARFLDRRNSASGVLGSGDFGVVRVSGSDRDVAALIAPYRRLVLG